MQVEICPENHKSETVKTYPDDNFLTKLDHTIQKIAKESGFIKYNIYKKCISTNGGNYLGELYTIDVKGKTVSGEKELNIFVKKIIDNIESVKIISVADVYKTELFVYKQLSKIYEELQAKADIPPEERYKMVKILDGTDADMLVMENISKKGFKTYHRMDVVSLKYLELCVANLAKFHALSFVIKQKHTEYFNKSLKTLNHPFILEEDYKKMLKDVYNTVIPHINENMKEKVDKLYKNLLKKMVQYLNDDSIKKCLCHGDYRPNNIMMKEEEGEVQEVISIDYQLNHYGCPVFDLLYLIYSCTDRDFRKAHMYNLKDLYYDSLEKFLHYFDLEADTIYPRKEFERVFKEKMDYGLLIILQIIPFLFASEADVPDLTQLSDVHFQIDSRFKHRMQGILEDFIELGFI